MAAAGLIATTGDGQELSTLVPFNAEWRYHQPTSDIGTSWRTNTFDDSQWQLGPGLFQGGEPLPYPQPFGTALLPPGGTRVVDYFRHQFVYNGPTNGVSLFTSNYLDDGAVIYLNGIEVGRTRMPSGIPNWTTRASSSPTTEGQVDVIPLPPSRLRFGQTNLLAVEVHQVDLSSSDVVFGCTLVALQHATPLVITSQPQSLTVSSPGVARFEVGVSGHPVRYHWQYGETHLGVRAEGYLNLGISAPPFSVVIRVIVSNEVSRVVSSDALLTVIEDAVGPTMVSAVLEETPSTNIIEVLFDEPILPASVTTNSFQIIQAGTSGSSAVAAVVTNIFAGGWVARARVSGPNWNPHLNYYIVANGITDGSSNVIAPNSAIAVSSDIPTRVVQMSDSWRYYDWLADAASFPTMFPMIFTNQGANAWYRNEFIENDSIWFPVSGVVYRTTSDPAAHLCAGSPVGDEIRAFTEFPLFLRRPLVLPPESGASGRVKFRHVADDGLVIYLNGTEVYRWNMPGPIGAPVDYLATRASSSVANSPAALCVTGPELLITNFVAGTNILAAAVYQAGIPPAGDGQADVLFGLEMEVDFLSLPHLTVTNGPDDHLRLNIVRQGTNVRLSWPDSGSDIYYGYILQETVGLGLGSSNATWQSMRNGTNGVVLPIHSETPRFYRLFRGPNSPGNP